MQKEICATNFILWLLTGDAYIGGFISGLSAEYSDEICMKLGTSVAAAKLLKKGARDGIPTSAELNIKFQELIDSNKKKGVIWQSDMRWFTSISIGSNTCDGNSITDSIHITVIFIFGNLGMAKLRSSCSDKYYDWNDTKWRTRLQ